MEKFEKPSDDKINSVGKYIKGAFVGAMAGFGAGYEGVSVQDSEKFESLLDTPAGVYSLISLDNEAEDSGILFQDESGQNHFSVANIPEDVKQKLIKAQREDAFGFRVWIQDGGVKIMKQVE